MVAGCLVAAHFARHKRFGIGAGRTAVAAVAAGGCRRGGRRIVRCRGGWCRLVGGGQWRCTVNVVQLDGRREQRLGANVQADTAAAVRIGGGKEFRICLGRDTV